MDAQALLASAHELLASGYISAITANELAGAGPRPSVGLLRPVGPVGPHRAVSAGPAVRGRGPLKRASAAVPEGGPGGPQKANYVDENGVARG